MILIMQVSCARGLDHVDMVLQPCVPGNKLTQRDSADSGVPGSSPSRVQGNPQDERHRREETDRHTHTDIE